MTEYFTKIIYIILLLLLDRFTVREFHYKMSFNTPQHEDFTTMTKRRARGMLVIEVASPRRPCSSVDKRHGRTFTIHGSRAYCARTGFGGVLFRVIKEGTLREGDLLELTARPHPTWNLNRVSALLYGSTSFLMHYSHRGSTRDEWCGTSEELREVHFCFLMIWYD